MSKTEVYSWRVDSDLKQRLEAEARAEKTSVGTLLDRIVNDWFGRGRTTGTTMRCSVDCMPNS
jgi:hypothetical protein